MHCSSLSYIKKGTFMIMLWFNKKVKEVGQAIWRWFTVMTFMLKPRVHAWDQLPEALKGKKHLWLKVMLLPLITLLWPRWRRRLDWLKKFWGEDGLCILFTNILELSCHVSQGFKQQFLSQTEREQTEQNKHSRASLFTLGYSLLRYFIPCQRIFCSPVIITG